MNFYQGQNVSFSLNSQTFAAFASQICVFFTEILAQYMSHWKDNIYTGVWTLCKSTLCESLSFNTIEYENILLYLSYLKREKFFADADSTILHIHVYELAFLWCDFRKWAQRGSANEITH